MQKLLIVDDSNALRAIIQRVLGEAGLDVDEYVEAGSGAAALALLRRDPAIGLVLADVDMPGMDGAELVHAMRERLRDPALPVVLMTSDETCPAVKRALAHGANGCVRKPFSADTIRAALEPWLIRRALAG